MSAAQYFSEDQGNQQPPTQEGERGFVPGQYGQSYPQGYQGQGYGNNQYAPPQGHPPPGPGPGPQGQGNGNWGMKPSEPYAQGQYQQPPPQTQQYHQHPPPAQAQAQVNPENGGGNMYGDTAPFSQANEKTGARFKPRKRLNDPIFLVLFLASFAGFCVLSGIAISEFIQQNGLGGGLGQGEGGDSATLD